MLNFTSLSGANLGKLSGNTSKNSYIIKVSFVPEMNSADFLIVCTKYAIHPILSIFLALTLLTIMLRIRPSINVNYSPLSILNLIFLFYSLFQLCIYLRNSCSVSHQSLACPWLLGPRTLHDILRRLSPLLTLNCCEHDPYLVSLFWSREQLKAIVLTLNYASSDKTMYGTTVN